jgi:hypothetical protein
MQKKRRKLDTVQVDNYIRLHRFNDAVALHIGGKTTYITAKKAEGLALLLLEAARDIKQHKFADAQFKTSQVKED